MTAADNSVGHDGSGPSNDTLGGSGNGIEMCDDGVVCEDVSVDVSVDMDVEV